MVQKTRGCISLIWAMDRNRLIGKDNGLPWKLPADLAYVKRVTMGHPLIMGRKTFESLGKPLPGRENVIVTRDRSYAQEGCVVVHSLNEALERYASQDVFVFGGTQLFEEALMVADKLYVTRIHAEFEGDTHFPAYDASEWVLESRTEGVLDEKNKYPHTFEVYIRIDGRELLK